MITRPPVELRKARKIWIAQEWAVVLVPDMAVSFQTAWWTFRKVKGAQIHHIAHDIFDAETKRCLLLSGKSTCWEWAIALHGMLLVPL
jgi:hypothetical protein